MHDVVAEALAQVRFGLAERVAVEIGQRDAGALGQQPLRRGPPDAARPAGDQRDPPGEALRLRQALQLCLLEQPVLDVERLLLGEPDVGVDAGRAAHDVDGVQVELARDPGGRLVAREAQHADARHQVDHRVGVAHRRAVRVPAALVVGGVALPIGLEPPVELAVIDLRRQDQRADLGAQEVVGAGGAERRQLLEPVRVHELEHRLAVEGMADLGLVLADPAADLRHQGLHQPLPLALRARLEPRTAERGAHVVGVEPGLRLLDDAQRRQIAGSGVVRPGEEAVPAQHHAHVLRVAPGDLLELEAEVVARPLPGQPADLVAVDLARELARAAAPPRSRSPRPGARGRRARRAGRRAAGCRCWRRAG